MKRLSLFRGRMDARMLGLAIAKAQQMDLFGGGDSAALKRQRMRQPVKAPGSRGGKFYHDDKGEVRYGEQPAAGEGPKPYGPPRAGDRITVRDGDGPYSGTKLSDEQHQNHAKMPLPQGEHSLVDRQGVLRQGPLTADPNKPVVHEVARHLHDHNEEMTHEDIANFIGKRMDSNGKRTIGASKEEVEGIIQSLHRSGMVERQPDMLGGPEKFRAAGRGLTRRGKVIPNAPKEGTRGDEEGILRDITSSWNADDHHDAYSTYGDKVHRHQEVAKRLHAAKREGRVTESDKHITGAHVDQYGNRRKVSVPKLTDADFPE